MTTAAPISPRPAAPATGGDFAPPPVRPNPQAPVDSVVTRPNTPGVPGTGTPGTPAVPTAPATPGATAPPSTGDFTPPTPPPGLTVNPEGWPAGSIQTPGGYRIVPEGNTNWSIYSPDQKPGETPTTRVWGDPHVTEKDGTRWDFTKDSNFVLPDGTLIRCDTTSETGQSVSQGLTIVAGNDKVDVKGVDGGSPTTTKDAGGATKWMNDNMPALANSNTFSLKTEGSDVSWFRSTGGQLEGKVVGATHNADGKNSYDQIIEGVGPNGQKTAGARGAVGGNGAIDFDTALSMFGIKSNGGNGFLSGDQAKDFFADVQRVFESMRDDRARSARLEQDLNWARRA
jgi:hypothetical protein